MATKVTAIRVYPIKSTAGQSLSSVQVEPRGLSGDRRWMLVDENSRFLTGRRFPILTQVQARSNADGLILSLAGRADITVTTPSSGEREVQVWKDTVLAFDAGDDASIWFSELIDHPCRLVHMADTHVRAVDPEHSQPGDTVSFADGFPVLLISEASLDALNQRLDKPVSMGRFRPNLVVSGCEPFAEDRWRRIAIGDVAFDLVKSCSRCVFTTVDPDTGEKHPQGEPLQTLMSFRRDPDRGVLFGQNLVARGQGFVQHGDPVRILESEQD